MVLKQRSHDHVTDDDVRKKVRELAVAQKHHSHCYEMELHWKRQLDLAERARNDLEHELRSLLRDRVLTVQEEMATEATELAVSASQQPLPDQLRHEVLDCCTGGPADDDSGGIDLAQELN